jgi:apolipoprotein N-acyltransferase
VVHAAISGITAVIDAHGNVSEHTQLFERTVVDTTVTPTRGSTPYVRFGEWVTLGALAATLVAVGIGFARRRRRSVDSTAGDGTPAVAPPLEPALDREHV